MSRYAIVTGRNRLAEDALEDRVDVFGVIAEVEFLFDFIH